MVVWDNMSNLSNNYGRAYEYIFLNIMSNEISKVRKVEIEKNNSYYFAKGAWQSIDKSMQSILSQSALAAIFSILELEPLILEDGNDKLELKIQPDAKGEEGDVRDILIVRRNIKWEIGLSLKHNHFAVKHSRLAKTLDFGERWFNIPCSREYWDQIAPVFSYLEEEQGKKSIWRELPSKEDDVYMPLLNAFVDEIWRSYRSNPNLPKKW